MFRVNNKNTRTPEWRRSSVFFTPFPSVSIVDFEQINVSWDIASICYWKQTSRNIGRL